METFLKLIPAFITLVIGTIAAYIAFQQHKVNHDRLRLDLFDRRIKVYDRLIDALKTIVHDGDREKKKHEIRGALIESMNESQFLFGDDITKYISHIWDVHRKIVRIDLSLNGKKSVPVEPKREKLCDDLQKLEEYLYAQITEAASVFSHYLKFKSLDFWSDLFSLIRNDETKKL